MSIRVLGGGETHTNDPLGIMTATKNRIYVHSLFLPIDTKHYPSKRPAHLAGPAVSVGGGTGRRAAASGRAPTPTAEAAAAAGCPVQ